MPKSIEEITKLLENMPMEDNRKPSELLVAMRARAEGTVVDEVVLRKIWLRNLPETIRAILSTTENTLDESAAIADRVNDALQKGVILTHRGSTVK